ncbi:serine hydrolase domain-containing protein [Eleftheria terrae]|uniref:serine hydrolase domain-containing protein n=1 Tax=Eleftheria terrae TaxID=1597781 RepID=UPI00263AF04C|nr:serine hydrolase domain-containing protein [Eleftheria terrae]WKB55186.1 beta-lactamase family protein [Eleftheria terrae]
MGTAGLVLPQACLVMANGRQARFEKWRQAFEASVPARMRAAKVVGASVAITARDTASHYAASFGFANLRRHRRLTVDTPMHLASVSKLFTACALVQLFERRGDDLHADVNDFIDVRIRNPHHPATPITPHQLLTHTSSISDEGYGDVSFPGDPKQSLSDFLQGYLVKGGAAYSPDGSFLKTQPGAQWNYSNVGVALAGHIVEKSSGQSFASYVEENLLRPLGMGNAHWYIGDFAPEVLAKPYRLQNGRFVELPQQGYPDVPAGMLRCSVSDLAKALRAMLGQATGAQALLSPGAVKQMLRRQVDSRLHGYQGLGWTQEATASHAVVGHTGSDNGASNMVALSQDQAQAVALLMNVDGTKQTARFRASVVDDLLAGAKLMA